MRKSFLFLAFACCLPFMTGCGGSKEPAVVADQDELAKYVAEHPEATAEPVAPPEGAAN